MIGWWHAGPGPSGLAGTALEQGLPLVGLAAGSEPSPQFPHERLPGIWKTVYLGSVDRNSVFLHPDSLAAVCCVQKILGVTMLILAHTRARGYAAPLLPAGSTPFKVLGYLLGLYVCGLNGVLFKERECVCERESEC